MRPAPKNTLSDKVVTVARISGVVMTLLVLGGISAFTIPIWIERPMLMIGAELVAALVSITLFVVLRPQMIARRWRYELLEHELYVQQGLIFLSRVNIPYIRIQNVDTAQGPVARWFGVSSVTVSTAGGAAEIPILDDEIAHELRNQLDARARSARQEETDAG